MEMSLRRGTRRMPVNLARASCVVIFESVGSGQSDLYPDLGSLVVGTLPEVRHVMHDMVFLPVHMAVHVQVSFSVKDIVRLSVL